ncbi:MAG: DUF2283 domain-containing protein [Streptosporangiaceae bacterium]
MKLSYDLTAGALYISLTAFPVAQTREIDDNTYIDLDSDGSVVGIEVVSIAHRWPLSEVLRRYDIPRDEAAQLIAYFKPVPAGTLMPAGTVIQAPPTVSMERNAPVLVGATP